MRLYTLQCPVKFIWLADFVFLLYIAQSRQSARLFLQSSELAPQPQEMVSPLLWFGGGTLACGWGGHFTELMWPCKVTLRSKKISIEWLWSVKVTLKVIKRRLKVFWWSCDGVPLKWNKKIAEPPVCHYGSNKPTLASQFEWSVNTFNFISFFKNMWNFFILRSWAHNDEMDLVKGLFSTCPYPQNINLWALQLQSWYAQSNMQRGGSDFFKMDIL